MAAPPINSHVYQTDFFGSFRERWAGRMVNDGDVRDIGGILVDVTGTVTRGQATHRSKVTAGPGSSTYDPSIPRHVPAPPDSGLPSSSLIALQTDQFDPAKLAGSADGGADAAGENPYAVSLPEWVDLVQREAAPITHISTLSYTSNARSKAEEHELVLAQIDRLKALADIETRLGEEFGEPVKLAWDVGSREYMMLRPGQDGYDSVMSVNDLMKRVPRELRQIGYSEGMIRDILA